MSCCSGEIISGIPLKYDPCSIVLSVWKLIACHHIDEIAVGFIVFPSHTDSQGIGNGSTNTALDRAPAKIPGIHKNITFPFLGRFTGHETEGPGHGILTKIHGLRTTQHLDPFQIKKGGFRHGGSAEHHTVYKGRCGLFQRKTGTHGAHTAYGDVLVLHAHIQFHRW